MRSYHNFENRPRALGKDLPAVWILSAERANLPEAENARRMAELQRVAQARRLHLSEGTGSWEGKQERVLILRDTPAARDVVGWALQRFEQDAVLFVDANRVAWTVSSKQQDAAKSGRVFRLGAGAKIGPRQITGRGVFPAEKLGTLTLWPGEGKPATQGWTHVDGYYYYVPEPDNA
jgi:hypothetical protein